jgi:hypothetical protein
MSYKKYIKRGSKIYGPYLYHSKKVNGRVTSEYLGKGEEKKNRTFPIFLLVIIALLFLSLVLIPANNKNQIDFSKLFASFKNSLTGFSISENLENKTVEQVTEAIISENITTPEIIINETLVEENATQEEQTNQPIELTNETLIVSNNTMIPEENETISKEISNQTNITTPAIQETNITTEINITENTTIQANFTILTEKNATIITEQYPAILGQPVKWKKQISPEAEGNLTIKLPKEAENIIVNELRDKNRERITVRITGGVTFFARLFAFLGLTGRAVDEQSMETEKEVELEIDDIQTEYEVEYETPAPYAIEQDTERGKQVEIVGLETIHYENILSFTDINEAAKEKIRLYRITNGLKEPTAITNYIDANSNGLIDRIEWITLQLSNETFEIIIEISKAEHLDSNRQFLSDIYNEVKTLDDIWSETIPDSHYIRVTFKKNLTNENDITLFPRVVSGVPKVEVYEVDRTTKIAEFTSLNSNEYNTVYLTNLPEGYSQDIFDLEISGGNIQLDYIVDPTTVVLVPRNTTQNCTWGGVTSNAFVFSTINPVSEADYTALNVSAGATMRVNAPAGNDSYVLWNVSLPQYESITEVFVRSRLSITTANKGDALSIALYNYSVGAWMFVNWTANQTALSNQTLGYNLTGTRLNNFIDNNRKIISFMSRTNGTANQNLSQDNMNATVIYEPLIAPYGYLIFPANNTNITSNINYTQRFEFNATDNLLLRNASLYVWNSTGGLSFSNSTTLTGTYDNENLTIEFNRTGFYNWNVRIADYYNNTNWTALNNYTYNFTQDLINPSINITFPQNNTNTSDINIDVNYTRSDTNLQACWYSNTSGVVNYTLAGCANITERTWLQGINNITIWANDTAGNQNNSKVTFTVDIEYPQFPNYWDNNGSLLDFGIGLFNVTVTSTNGTVWLEIDGTNITATNKSGSATRFNATYTFSSAGTYPYIWHSWGNGTSKNYNVSETRSYTVNTTTPTMCSPTLDADWIISDTQICDGVQVTTGTGQIFITNTGLLYLINGANVTTRGINISKTGDRVFINKGGELRVG